MQSILKLFPCHAQVCVLYCILYTDDDQCGKCYYVLSSVYMHEIYKRCVNQFTGGVPSVPFLLPPKGNVLRWESLDDNGAEILQLVVTFTRY